MPELENDARMCRTGDNPMTAPGRCATTYAGIQGAEQRDKHYYFDV